MPEQTSPPEIFWFIPCAGDGLYLGAATRPNGFEYLASVAQAADKPESDKVAVEMVNSPHFRGSERDPTNPLFRQVGQNYLKGRLRSLPDFARRYYADLVETAAPAAPTSGY